MIINTISINDKMSKKIIGKDLYQVTDSLFYLTFYDVESEIYLGAFLRKSNGSYYYTKIEDPQVISYFFASSSFKKVDFTDEYLEIIYSDNFPTINSLDYLNQYLKFNLNNGALYQDYLYRQFIYQLLFSADELNEEVTISDFPKQYQDFISMVLKDHLSVISTDQIKELRHQIIDLIHQSYGVDNIGDLLVNISTEPNVVAKK